MLIYTIYCLAAFFLFILCFYLSMKKAKKDLPKGWVKMDSPMTGFMLVREGNTFCVYCPINYGTHKLFKNGELVSEHEHLSEAMFMAEQEAIKCQSSPT